MRGMPDPRRAIAAAGAVAVAGSVVAGLFAIDPPWRARAYQLDEARLGALQSLAGAAQCAYSFTGRAPASIAQIREDYLMSHAPVAGGDCAGFSLPEEMLKDVDYSAPHLDRIRLCAVFSLPTRPQDNGRPDIPIVAAGQFPELATRRPSAGRYCFDVRLNRLPPLR